MFSKILKISNAEYRFCCFNKLLNSKFAHSVKLKAVFITNNQQYTSYFQCTKKYYFILADPSSMSISCPLSTIHLAKNT